MVDATGPQGTPIPVLPSGTWRVYGVLLHGVNGTSTWAVEPGLLRARVPATGRAGGVWAPAWTRVAGPVTITKQTGAAGITANLTVLYAPYP